MSETHVSRAQLCSLLVARALSLSLSLCRYLSSSLSLALASTVFLMSRDQPASEQVIQGGAGVGCSLGWVVQEVHGIRWVPPVQDVYHWIPLLE